MAKLRLFFLVPHVSIWHCECGPSRFFELDPAEYATSGSVSPASADSAPQRTPTPKSSRNASPRELRHAARPMWKYLRDSETGEPFWFCAPDRWFWLRSPEGWRCCHEQDDGRWRWTNETNGDWFRITSDSTESCMGKVTLPTTPTWKQFRCPETFGLWWFRNMDQWFWEETDDEWRCYSWQDMRRRWWVNEMTGDWFLTTDEGTESHTGTLLF